METFLLASKKEKEKKILQILELVAWGGRGSGVAKANSSAETEDSACRMIFKLQSSGLFWCVQFEDTHAGFGGGESGRESLNIVKFPGASGRLVFILY